MDLIIIYLHDSQCFGSGIIEVIAATVRLGIRVLGLSWIVVVSKRLHSLARHTTGRSHCRNSARDALRNSNQQ